MLRIDVVMNPEGWDEINQRFVEPTVQTLELEHSLLSLSKWESTWCKPFLSKNEKTDEEIRDYIRCMTLTPDVDPSVYYALSRSNVEAIRQYIDAPMTATTISNVERGKRNREIVTAEIIFHWMFTLNIPLECQEWHLNKLITMIKVSSIKNAPPKKMSKSDIMAQNRALNEARRKKHNSKG